VGGTSVPAYRQIIDDLTAAIRAGEYSDGRGLPSESELSRVYGVSRGTVRQAFVQLRAAGVVSSRRGARRQVQPAQRVQSMTELLSFSRWARSIGEPPSSRVVTVEHTPSPAAVAAALEIAEGTRVLHVVRVRLLGGVPAMLEDTYYPEEISALVLGTDLASESITERLEHHGVILERAEHRIDAVSAETQLADLLDVVVGTALLRTTRRTRDPVGRVVEHSVDLYRGDAVAFLVMNSADVSTTSRVAADLPAG
jgi:GntR family transcriptional regulator